ncbi:hypothetical protein DIPPA_28010 [Diplonema papillatum]|nr:hypothetical protein DIPPA_28010 [Diplonema papillatum]
MAEIGIPESMEIVVEVKKSQVGDPMGTLLDPESLELLEVRDGTAAVASDAKECVGWRLRRVNDEPVASMDQVLELAKAAANVRLAFYYDPAAESSGDFADKYLASQAYRPETPASCCRHNATVRQLVTSSLLTRGMSRLLAAAKPSSILTKASLNDTSAAVAVMPEHPLPISTFLWTVDRSVASSTDSAYRAKLLQESFAAASKQLSVLASLAENADFLGRCRALLRHVDNPQVFATSVPQKVVEEESVLAALVSDRLLRVLKDAECAPYVASSVFYAGLRTNLRSHPCEKKRAVARNIGHIAKGHMRHQQQQQQKQKQAA